MKDMKSRSWIMFFMLFIVALILTIYYFSDIKREVTLIKKVNVYWLTTAIACQFITYLFTAFIYRFLIKVYRPMRIPKLPDLIKASVISLFLNQAIPSAGISGNAFFFSFMSRHGIPRSKVVTLILVELVIFYAAMELIILFLLIACTFFYKSLFAFKSTLSAGLIIYFIFGLAIALAGRKNRLNRLFSRILKTRIVKKIFENIHYKINTKIIMEKKIEFSALLQNKTKVAWVLFFQLFVVAFDAFTLWALFFGIGYPLSGLTVVIVLVSTKIISILPFSPGALILYESSMTFFFMNTGVPLGTAIIVTIIYRLLAFWFPIPAGALLYRGWLKRSDEFTHAI